MRKQFFVGEWMGHGEVKKGKCGFHALIVMPFSSKAAAERCLEGLGNGEKLVKFEGSPPNPEDEESIELEPEEVLADAEGGKK